jgi:hypothetical protein
MCNVGMYNECIKIVCSSYLEHIKIYQSYKKKRGVYFEYIKAILQVYWKFIIPNNFFVD